MVNSNQPTNPDLQFQDDQQKTGSRPSVSETGDPLDNQLDELFDEEESDLLEKSVNPDLILEQLSGDLQKADNVLDLVMQVTHDVFFYFLFKMPCFAIAFFKQILPQELLESIDIDKLVVQNKVYVTDELQKIYPDIVYAVPIRRSPDDVSKNGSQSDSDDEDNVLYIKIIMESKSTDPYYGIVQLGSYSMEEIRENIERTSGSRHVGKKTRLSPPFTILFVHGRRKYNGPRDLKALYHLVKGLGDNCINLKPLIYDLYEISYDDIPADAEVPELEVGLTLLKAVFDPEVGMIAEKALEKLQPYIHQEAYQKFVQVSLSYLTARATYLKTEDAKKISRLFYPVIERSFAMPGLLQRTRNEGRQEGRQEGRKEGRKEGRQEGLQEGQVKFILNYLRDRFGDVSDEIVQKLEMIHDIDQLESLFTTALHCSSLWEFEKNL